MTNQFSQSQKARQRTTTNLQHGEPYSISNEHIVGPQSNAADASGGNGQHGRPRTRGLSPFTRISVRRRLIIRGMVTNGSTTLAPDYLTPGETADLLRVSERTVRRRAESGELPGVRVGDGPRAPLRIRSDALAGFLRPAARGDLAA